MFDHDEIVKDFLQESAEALDNLDRELVRLETQTTNKDLLNSVFRIVHTIKGTCGFLEFGKLERVTHVGENLLDGLRAGKHTFNSDIASALFRLLDAMRTMLKDIEVAGKEGPEEYEELVELLKSLHEHRTLVTPSRPEQHSAPVRPAVATESAPEPAPIVAAIKKAPQQQATSESPSPSVVQPSAGLAQPLSSDASLKGAEAPKSAQPSHREQEKHTVSAPSAVEPQSSGASEKRATEGASADLSAGSVADTALRVDVGLLDQLMNLVGELVLTRNQLLQFSKSVQEPSFLQASQRLNLITSELQEGVMKTRMQPIANIWNKFPRVVRDLSKQLNKQVALEMEGKETDLDKTIIEAIKDPLTHIIRNAVDHGVELPDVRVSKGKAPQGTINLRAFHEGGHVIIEIADDGAGLNPERIKQKALEKGLVAPDRLARFTEQDIYRLIFMPGFSTAEAVTNISGRGVGMDVVRSNIEKIGGQVDVMSRLGAGSTIRIKIPLTLAIIPTLLVSVCGQRLALPQVSLIELLQIDHRASPKAIEKIQGASFYRLRGDLLPLVDLARELKLRNVVDSDREVTNVVVVKADDVVFGLVVDEVFDTEEIVVKPLGRLLKQVSVFAGATIMGDGKVALIVDVLGVARAAKVLNGMGEQADHGSHLRSTVEETSEDVNRQLLILMQAGSGTRLALPLELVTRLEKFERRQLECAGGRPVIQYRDSILPLINLEEFFTGKSEGQGDNVDVVVYSTEGRSIGFVVTRIEDIVEDVVAIQAGQKRLGTSGAAIIQKRVTDILDPVSIIDSVHVGA